MFPGQPTVDLSSVIQKEALYCAIGRCASRLKDVIPFNEWLEHSLVPEARETNPKSVTSINFFPSMKLVYHATCLSVTVFPSSNDASHGSWGNGSATVAPPPTILGFGMCSFTFYRTVGLEQTQSCD